MDDRLLARRRSEQDHPPRPGDPPAGPLAPDSDFETRTINRVMARLIPFIVFLYVFNYLDRVNVSFAKLTMCEDLGFSEKVYGFGAGVFFVAYFLFEVPSNLVMQRVGTRLIAGALTLRVRARDE